ncbi:MAG: CRTAC1 family protein [Planctomycetota bacterium]|nr:MAG: CRTAC1 family protein [Planctomycetota bacterium]
MLDRVQRRLKPGTPLSAAPELPELRAEPSEADLAADAGMGSHGAAASPAQEAGVSGTGVSSSPTPVARRTDVDASRTPPRQFVFRDDARRVGLDFVYFNGSPPDAQRHLLFEFTGGGVGVVDFDRDSRPDLYFAQGRPWSGPAMRASAEQPTDRLFRNRPEGRFEDVTAASGIGRGGFGQGVAVGDFDNDGFPDIYVANIGTNRLLQNNGDGTFTDRGPLAGDRGRWTTSCAIADLNGDGSPDIYDVNYLEGPDVFERVCYNGPHARTCPPRFFDAAQDQLYLSGGDGTFREVSDEAGVAAAGGKGLGVLVFDSDRDGWPELFVANDQVPNFYFVRQADGDGLRFSEQAFARGLAVDGAGRPNACMGVAFADADGDGWFDLFVTNFSHEANVLYRGTAAGVFEDATDAAGLADPGFRWLGFGTRFLDADRDGDADLVVLNGHVDDFGFQGTPFAMPPQLFENLGGGRFREVAPQRAGPFFEEARVGRALARVDWNGDGRCDLVGTYLHAPAALISNATRPAGHAIALRLVGRHCARDAIGATITIRYGEHVRHDQLVAGDGYMASNERVVSFGLGAEQRVDRVTVRWPCGRVQHWDDLPGDHLWLLIESAARPACLRKFAR